jgi:hypothetical protein
MRVLPFDEGSGSGQEAVPELGVPRPRAMSSDLATKAQLATPRILSRAVQALGLHRNPLQYE